MEGDKGGGKLPPGKGEGGSYSFSNTPRAVGPANLLCTNVISTKIKCIKYYD